MAIRSKPPRPLDLIGGVSKMVGGRIYDKTHCGAWVLRPKMKITKWMVEFLAAMAEGKAK